jgi:uncharacterized protein YidB (DUF937 family)
MGLFDILGNGGARRGGGMSPIALALLGTLAYRTLKGKGPLANILGTGQPAAAAGGVPAGNSATAPSAGGLGGLLSGLGGGGLGAGLKDLLERFRQSGHEDKAQSWVSTGANHSITPPELEQVLGAERMQWLMEQTGLPKEQLLAGLSNQLPETIDKLTPNGQIPTDAELEKQLQH